MQRKNCETYLASCLFHVTCSSIPGHKPKTGMKIRSSIAPPLSVKPSQKPKFESVITIEDVKSEMSEAIITK